MDPRFFSSIFGDSLHPDIEDRRPENFGGAWNDDGSFAWQRVPQTLKALGVDVGNTIWGTPQIPEAPDTPLSDALGKRDMRIVPQINSRSPLDQAIDQATDELSRFRKPGEKLGSDVPFTQREFSRGYSAPQSFAPVDAIIRAESGGNPNATNPSSSASGLGQFIDSTWLATIKQAMPDLAQGKSDAELLALKTNPDLSRQMTEAYANQNQVILSKAGVPVTPGSTYLAHFAGPGGAVKVLQADPNAPVESVLGDAAVKANPFLRGMTASGLQAWADKKMGGSAPQPQTAQASPSAPPSAPLSQPPGPPMQLAPQQAPIFAPPVQQPQQQAQEAPAFAQIPDQQAPPIFYAPRKPVSLAGLKSAFRAPVFPRG